MKNSAIHFLQMIANGHVSDAYDTYVAKGFTHHNPWFKGDANSLMKAMDENAKENPEKILEVKQVVQEDNRVVVFSHIRQNKNERGAAVVHIFRFNKKNLIKELWDVEMVIPENSINMNGLF